MTSSNLNFPCYQCGACCKQTHLSEATQYLSRGDGVCIHFSESTNCCTVYATRPEICRVALFYEKHLHAVMSWEQYVEMNLAYCSRLEANLAN